MNTIDIEMLKRLYNGTAIEIQADGELSVMQKSAAVPEVLVNTEHMESADLVLLANRLLWPISEDEAALDGVYAPYVFWIQERGIWNDVHEGVAAEAFKALLKGYGQPTDARGLIFEKADRPAAVVFTLHALLFSWDAYLVPLSASFVSHLSHDGYIKIKTDTSTYGVWLRDRFAAWESQTKNV
jgi:hypothetical protein